MEELKILVGMVADLPGTALWVVGGYFVYKIVIVGSVYGTIKFALDKVRHIVQIRNEASVACITEQKRTEVVDTKIESMCIVRDGTYQHIIRSLEMVKDRNLTEGSGMYIHHSEAKWLREAIQDKILKDKGLD